MEVEVVAVEGGVVVVPLGSVAVVAPAVHSGSFPEVDILDYEKIVLRDPFIRQISDNWWPSIFFLLVVNII